jgi:prepilin-type N-terminal cleavage/methylation domain-containing protein
MKYRPDRAAFTLVELIAVIAIIAILLTLIAPEYSRMIDRANSVACAANLRQIGVAVGLYSAENESKLPFINNPARPVYTDPADLPDGVQAMTMVEAFGPYGVTEKVLRCPTDASRNNYFASEGTSYEWRPWIDGESTLSPKVFTRRGALAIRSVSRIRIVMDTDNVHKARQNTLFAGRVQSYE